MSLWSLIKGPMWLRVIGREPPRLTMKGWETTDTPSGVQEVIVAMGNRTTDAGISNCIDVRFDKTSYNRNDPITVYVYFSEAVDVISGATIEISWSGISGNLTATVLVDHTNIFKVPFQTVIPNEQGTLDISTGTIIYGDIYDTGTLIYSNKVVPSFLDPYFNSIVVP